ncbi:uncharacterized protein HD556DRAFT_1451357 [Suillus plorans]|uniref:Uncharacterized protein n=1 Tax=Suillus plorans TaxID=116603 RepID=A0A9P7A9K3_9AGAM|nr:uncharacterized protein HD556DRAFT_1451357 [Suillus plorans]KAG1784851.1 hypothetical protein HD556DRAFT_1451357 [Suillus plorans]
MSDRNDAAEAILLGVSASNSTTDNLNAPEDVFAGVAFSDDYICTPGAENLAYGRAAPDVDRAMKLVEQFEEEYQQLKKNVEDWNARVKDTTKILPILKKRQIALDITPCKSGHNRTNSPECASATGSIAPKKRRRLQTPFEFSPRPTRSKTIIQAISSIEGAIERQTLVLSRICEALGDVLRSPPDGILRVGPTELMEGTISNFDVVPTVTDKPASASTGLFPMEVPSFV